MFFLMVIGVQFSSSATNSYVPE